MSDCEKMGGLSHVSVGVSPQALGGSGGMGPPPLRKFLIFRLSEMASGAFSGTFLTCNELKKFWL